MKGIRTICNVHNVVGHESNFLDRILTRLFLSGIDLPIVHSSKNLVQLQALIGRAGKFLPIGMPSYLVETCTRDEARRALDLPQDARVLLAFGNIRRYKGIDLLLHGFALIHKSDPSAVLVIAGENWIDWNPFQKLIDDYQLGDSVRLHLNFIERSDVKLFFTGADLLVLPYTHFDAQSGPGRIALGYELPMLLSDVGGLKDLVKDHASCLINPHDPKDIHDKAIAIFSNSELSRKLATDCKLIQVKFRWEKIAIQTLELYRHITHSSLNRN